ncbi:MAG: fumarylacetoacetate hydrolase family protein [Deltaproteobacteria bacterium]|nr:fumarylacetoacetate hydrolase family protein [Deltaproteobacteria bacterium]
MKIARFSAGGRISWGIVEHGAVFEAGNYSFGSIPDEKTVKKGPERPLSSVRLLPPVLPSKIVAIGLNYRAHAVEFGKTLPEEPMLFLKPSTAVIGPGDDIIYPSHMSRRIDYEAELAVVIGRKAKAVSTDDAKAYILGYTCFNDVTARDLQAKDIQYTRAKGFDTFAPIGPWIETELNPLKARVESYLNNEKRQDGRAEDMIFNAYELVSFVSRVMTLLPGDVIATGTPSGAGKMNPGDTVEVRIEGIGALKNTVKAR